MRRLVNLGSRCIETEVDGTGKKTVVILPGMNCPIDDWYEVIRAVSRDCRVIAFNRAGCGSSEPNPDGPSVLNTVLDLRTLLDRLDVHEPVVLVGHSYGGLCVQRFCRKFPDWVEGVVLVDSTSVDLQRLDTLELPILNERQSDEDWLNNCKRLSSLTSAEISQEIDTRLTPHQLTLPSNVQQRIIEFSTNPVLYSTMVKEVEIWRQCAQETKTAEPFPEVPLKVIARDPQYSMKLMARDGIPVSEAELFELTWNKLLVEQAELSPRGELIIAGHSGHSVHEYRPDIVIDAIRNAWLRERRACCIMVETDDRESTLDCPCTRDGAP